MKKRSAKKRIARKKNVRVKKNAWRAALVFIACLIVVYVAALAGTYYTSQGVRAAWYESVRPSITPPSYVFPVVWNILFALLAISLFAAWSNANLRQRTSVLALYVTNLVLNVLWSAFFFGMQSPLLAFIDLIVLWLSIAGIFFYTWKISKAAALAVVPYLLWVTFAGVLNFLSI